MIRSVNEFLEILSIVRDRAAPFSQITKNDMENPDVDYRIWWAVLNADDKEKFKLAFEYNGPDPVPDGTIKYFYNASLELKTPTALRAIAYLSSLHKILCRLESKKPGTLSIFDKRHMNNAVRFMASLPDNKTETPNNEEEQ